jgi:hypothetical protein
MEMVSTAVYVKRGSAACKAARPLPVRLIGINTTHPQNSIGKNTFNLHIMNNTM